MSLIPLLALLAAGASGQTADQLYRQGKYEEAASAYRQLVQDTPNSAEALAGLGRSLLQLRRANEAVAYLARAVQLQPASVEMKQALARAYLDTGNAGAAQGLIEFLDQSDPHNAGTLFLLGEWMYRGGFYERASQALRESLALHPDNPRKLSHTRKPPSANTPITRSPGTGRRACCFSPDDWRRRPRRRSRA
jgi:tetratricopeptide (TPR) repeat protein